MIITWCRPDGKQEARKREGIFQQEETWMTIELDNKIVHPFIFGKLLHDATARRIIQDGRSKKFHLGKLGNLKFWEQYVKTVNHVSDREANVDYLGLHWAYFEAYPPELSDARLHINEDRFRIVADRRVIEIPDVQLGLSSDGDLIY